MVLILFQYPQFSWAGKIIPIKGWWMRGRMEGTGGVQVGRAHRSQPWPWPPPGWASSTVPHLTMDSTRAQERQGTPVTSTTICQTIPGSIHSKPIPRVIPIISHCSHHFPRRSGGLSKEPMVRWCHTNGMSQRIHSNYRLGVWDFLLIWRCATELLPPKLQRRGLVF